MANVTTFIANLKQPRGGYIPLKLFDKVTHPSSHILHDQENISPIIVGIAVDLLIRMILFGRENQFRLQHHAATIINDENYFFELEHWLVKDLNDNCIRSACQLSGYDVIVRAGVSHYREVRHILPDKGTIANIREMVMRGVMFFETKNPIHAGMDFFGGYTDKVTNADADILTQCGIWDIKTTKNNITSKHTLQVYIYTLLALRAIDAGCGALNKFDQSSLSYCGFFNPRKNESYSLHLAEIGQEVTDEILELMHA